MTNTGAASRPPPPVARAATVTRDGRVVIDGGRVARRIAPDARRTAPSTAGVVDARLLVPALVMWAGVALTLGVPVRGRAVAALVSVLAGTALAWTGRPRHGRWSRKALVGAGALLALGLGLSASVAHESVREAGPLGEWAAQGAVVRVSGLVLGEPVPLGGNASGRLILRIRVTDAVGRGVRTEVSAPVLATVGPEWGGVSWHDEITAVLRLQPADPGDGVIARASALAPPQVRPERGLLLDVADHVRRALRGSVEHLPADPRGLVPALVVGDTSASPAELTDDMRTTGLTHLSAVSGANVSLILAAVGGLLRPLALPRRLRPWVLILTVAFFVVVARPEPSVIRAATMGVIGLIGLSRSTRVAGPPALAGAIVALLTLDPWLSRSYGFVLSALATLGLLLFVRPWSAAITRGLPRRLGWMATPLAIPLAAQAACGPVIVLLQGTVSIVGLPANLLTAPLVAPITIGGAGLAVLGSFWPWAARSLAWIPGAPAWVVGWIAHTLARQTWGNAPWPDGARGAWLLAGLTAVVLVAGPRMLWEARRHRLSVATGMALTVAVTWPTASFTWPPPGWQLVACDVGQGDALVLRSSRDRAVLVDAGPDPRLIDQCLDRLDIRALDAVVLTHFHADHVDGLRGALSGRPVGRLLVSGVRDPPDQVDEVLRLATSRQIPVDQLRTGDRFTFGAVAAYVLWPAREIHLGSVPNNGSIVLDVSIGDLDALLTGDIEREAAHALFLALRQDPAMLARARRYEVVKSPHHGSSNLDPDFMGLLSAPSAIVSVGKDNDYGHPRPQALAALADMGAAVWRTDQRSDIALGMVGGDLVVRTRH